jgi:catechol 2,3-dioxygenase-like lactoylglutathione lyase family enzyme
MKLAMVTLVVDDYDEAIAHFRDGFGFTVIEDVVLSPIKRWVVMSTGDGGSHVLIAKASGPEQEAAIGNQTGGRVGFFVDTQDFEADLERAIAAGAKLFDGPRTEEYGTVAVVKDRYGNKWDLVRRTS